MGPNKGNIARPRLAVLMQTVLGIGDVTKILLYLIIALVLLFQHTFIQNIYQSIRKLQNNVIDSIAFIVGF